MTCAYCSASIIGHKRKYCDQKCRQRAYAPTANARARERTIARLGIRLTATCPLCGSEVPPSLGTKPRKWCSESCRVRGYEVTTAGARERKNAMRKARRIPSRHDLTCAICGSAFVAKMGHTKYCSTKCRYRAGYVGRRGRHANALREPYTYNEIAERDRWTCGICSEWVDRKREYPDPGYGSIDHVTPLALGGTDTPENVQLAHLGCNWKKGHRVSPTEALLVFS